MIRFGRQPNAQAEANRLADQTEALLAANARRLAEAAQMPGLGEIRADRTIPIKSRRHSIRHLAIR